MSAGKFAGVEDEARVRAMPSTERTGEDMHWESRAREFTRQMGRKGERLPGLGHQTPSADSASWMQGHRIAFSRVIYVMNAKGGGLVCNDDDDDLL